MIIDNENKISENQIISDFGKEWKEYDNNKLSIEEKEKIFDYFYIFPWDKINLNSIGFDAGCGSEDGLILSLNM